MDALSYAIKLAEVAHREGEWLTSAQGLIEDAAVIEEYLKNGTGNKMAGVEVTTLDQREPKYIAGVNKARTEHLAGEHAHCDSSWCAAAAEIDGKEEVSKDG